MSNRYALLLLALMMSCSDGIIDQYEDADGDEFPACDFENDNGREVNLCGQATHDCDDTDETVYPGAPISCELIDRDCNGIVDAEEDTVDCDGDRVTPEEGDCDNFSSAASPDFPEVCGDGIDNNCNGQIDEEGCE